MEQVDAELASWAVDRDGLAAIATATAGLDAGQDPLTVGTGLRRRGLAPDRAAFAGAAAAARRRARAAGIAHADQLVLTREAVEQASRPAVAAWRAARVAAVATGLSAGGAEPHTVVDLCAGLGSDATAIAAAVGSVVAVERDPGRAVLLAHRAAVTGLPVEVVVGDALAPPVDLAGRLVHADPDRRDARGARARRLADHDPGVGRLLQTLADHGAAGGLVTVAAGTAWDDPQLPADACLTFVEHDGDLVEAVLEVGAASTARARAITLPAGEVVERGATRDRLPVGPVGAHLVLPSPALVRARLHDLVGHRHGARRVADGRALLTADRPVRDDPWIDSEPVVAVIGPRPRDLRRWLRSDEARRAGAEHGVELLTHGLDLDPSAVLRAAGAVTGPHGLRVHVVRRDHDACAVVTAPDGR